MQTVDYLAGFSPETKARAHKLALAGLLEPRLLERYPDTHDITSDRALDDYAQELKRTWLRSSPPLAKVCYSSKISTLHRALGLHTYAVRVQGNKLKKKHELRVASVFKELPPEFLRMVVVHELAHLRHADHDKAFYRLCQHMEPDYLRYEADLRLLLHARQVRDRVTPS